jgi:hypothetical protein
MRITQIYVYVPVPRWSRRHVADLDDRIPEVADGCRADIDRVLDRRSWLTLPVVGSSPR